MTLMLHCLTADCAVECCPLIDSTRISPSASGFCKTLKESNVPPLSVYQTAIESCTLSEFLRLRKLAKLVGGIHCHLNVTY